MSARTAPLVPLVILVWLAGGCNTKPYITQERLDNGLVILLPGIEGPSLLSVSLRGGLMKGRLPYALEIYNWHAGRLGASYAFAEAESRKRAVEIALHVRDYRRTHPGRPVFIVGHSAGGAIAVFTAEAVPPWEPLDGVVLLAPALGPEYELTEALRGARGRMVNCHAAGDLFLRTLTTLGRNLDGTRGRTAGQEGFLLPPDAAEERREAFRDLRQIRWEAAMIRKGNWGGHRGWVSRRWVAATLAPLISQWAGSTPEEKGADP